LEGWVVAPIYLRQAEPCRERKAHYNGVYLINFIIGMGYPIENKFLNAM
jgi:hypothetical protein